jgi:hypothetical protein
MTKKSVAPTQASNARSAKTLKPSAPTPASSNAEIQLALTAPRGASSGSLGALQRLAGNRAVTRLIQAKLKVGPANDRFEQEADRVARQVTTQPETAPTPRAQRAPTEPKRQAKSQPALPGELPVGLEVMDEGEAIGSQAVPPVAASRIQRHPSHTEEEEIQAKRLPIPIVQRHPSHTEEEEIQAKLFEPTAASATDVQRTVGLEGGDVGNDFESQLSRSASGGAKIPDSIRTDMESHIGADFSGVRVHQGGQAIQLNREINAKAFTHGQDIYFGSGEYNPRSQSGKFLLAHELTHVAQQNPHTIQAYRGPVKNATPKQVSPKRIQRGIGSWLKKKGSQALGLGRKAIQAVGAIAGGALGAAVGGLAGGIVGGIAAALGAVGGAIAGAIGGAYTAGRAGANYGNNIVSKIFFGLLGGIGGGLGGLIAGGVAGSVAGAGLGVATTLGGAGAGAMSGGGHGFERMDVKNFTSRKKRQDRLSEKFGTQIGSDQSTFTHGSLDSLDEVLSGLPRSHTKGNEKIKQIAEQRNDPNSPIAGASSYGNGKLNIVREIPKINIQIPSSVYASMQKGPWRGLMDKMATAPFFSKKGARAQLNKSEDKTLGLGKRSLFGVNAPMNKEDLAKWTIRHEMGHAVDDQIKFTQKRARLTQFGGWKQYKNEGLEEPAKAFLKVGGISSEDYNKPIEKVVTRTRINEELTEEAQRPIKEKYSKMQPASNKDAERSRDRKKREELEKARVKENYTETLRKTLFEIFLPRLEQRTDNAEEHAESVEAGLTDAMGENPSKESLDFKSRLLGGIRRATKALRIAQVAPYFLSDGGPAIDNRVFQIDHYGTWVSYLKAARRHFLSNYQFSSPKEWFAEVYAAYYNPGNQAARSKLNPETLAFFDENLGKPVALSKEEQSKEDKSNKKLEELEDIPELDKREDEVDQALLSLQGMRAMIAEMRKEAGQEDDFQPQAPPKEYEETSGPKMVTRDKLQPGDILMLHGGAEAVMAGQAFANGIRALFKGFIFGWSEYSSAKYYDYGHAALYVGGGQIAHATGEGVKVTSLDSGSEYAVFRNKNTALGTAASGVAKKWGSKNLKYDAWKATFGGGLGTSLLGPLGRDQAKKMQEGQMPEGFYCSEFVIAVYQVAALDQIKAGHKNTEMLSLTAQSSSPQRLISVLHQKAKGDDPTWDYVGVHMG